ncbi:hypothetical protein K456DRAFT_50974 [Colletotrichum gloeosporioides 23]|nr:hypothetical protein K456DRAFT_50974 [Colletotrichum gloeosporioides 23]
MAPSKRALLIGSPLHGLLGTGNDLKTMSDLLESHGFDVENGAYVTKLFRDNATRQNILEAWEALILNTSQGDAVVIYYSGHGVCVKSDGTRETSGNPSQIQFIVPYDFDCSLDTWKGISDGELSLLLRKTTEKTKNVTYILDCCHSARAGRDLATFSVLPKAFSLSEVRPEAFSLTGRSLYTDLSNIMKDLRLAGKLTEDHLETNPHAVRIAAAATNETAWEYHENGYNHMGLLTKNLVKAIMRPSKHRSWRDIMLEVSTLVEQDYPEGKQHPRSAGPDNRTPFSLTTAVTGAYLATIWDDEYTVVGGGRLNGVQVGDIYTITPFGSHGQSGEEITRATVVDVNAFAATISPTPKPSEYGSSEEQIMGLAVLHQCHNRWAVSVSENMQGVDIQLHRSVFLKQSASDENPLVTLDRRGNQVFLHSGEGLQLAEVRFNDKITLKNGLERLLDKARDYGQAQNIQLLRSGTGEEAFGANVEIELGLERRGTKQVLLRRSEVSTKTTIDRVPVHIDENDRMYVYIENRSKRDIFVNAFNIDAAGKTTLVSKAWERGIDIGPGRSQTLATRAYPLRGIPLQWPKGIPKHGYVEERMVFVITNREVDLRDLDAATKAYGRRGTERAAAQDNGITPYDVEHVRYHLRPSSRPY